jgi:hypothetical protein
MSFLISNFRHVLNVVCFLLGNSPVSEFRRRGNTQKKAYNRECHAWHVAHWRQAHHILHACTIDKIILLMCWRVHTKYVDDTTVRPELWAALERYTTVCYLQNLSLHSVLQINTTIDTEFILCNLHSLNSLCFSRHYSYYLADEFTAVFVRTLAGV